MVISGNTLTKPADPKIAGYDFVDWYTDANMTDTWDFDTDTAGSTNITLYAKLNPRNYTVAYAGDGISIASPNNILWKETVLPVQPTRPGYTFKGWNVTAGGPKADGAGRRGVTADDTYGDIAENDDTTSITLTGQWKAKSYTVAYDLAGGTSGTITDKKVGWETSGIVPAAADNPTRSGYTFQGWIVTGGAAPVSVSAGDTRTYGALVNADTVKQITLTAQWAAIPPASATVIFYNNYDASDNSAYALGSAANANIVVGGGLSSPIGPERAGYTFAGWYRDRAGLNAWNFGSDRVTTTTLALYAKWSINTYTVTFVDGQGGTLGTQSVEYGAAATAPANPTRIGYTFAGWDSGFATVATNLTITATWSINTYTVRFVNYNGIVLKSQTVEYGKNASAPANPTRTGYTFAGWNGTYSNVTGDVTVTAIFNVNDSSSATSGGGSGSSSGSSGSSSSGSSSGSGSSGSAGNSGSATSGTGNSGTGTGNAAANTATGTGTTGTEATPADTATTDTTGTETEIGDTATPLASGATGVNIDTNGDGAPDLNIDANGDGTPDLNIDTDGDGAPDQNIDTDGDGIADKNLAPASDTNVESLGDSETPKASGADEKAGSALGTIIPVAGGALAVVLIALLAYILHRRKRLNG
jgi:uncharacterized repeat protein (TIGR02543 family)